MANEPVQCLLEDVKTFRASRVSHEERAADPDFCDQLLDSDLVASAWNTFAQRAVQLSPESSIEEIRRMLRHALQEVEFLPRSIARANCANSLARSAKLLEDRHQAWFFRAAVRLITDFKPDGSQGRDEVSSLLCECAISLKFLHKEALQAGAEFLLHERGTDPTVAEEVYRSIAERVKRPVGQIQEWEEGHELYQRLTAMMRAGSL